MRVQRLLFTIAILFAASVAGLAQTGKVEGRVTFSSDMPLHTAVVSISAQKLSVRTDTDGRYVIDNVPAGRHAVLVHFEGFADQIKIVELSAGQSVTLDFKLGLTGVREQVTVTAAGTEQSTFDAFQTVTSIGSIAVRERPSTSLGELLEGETGVAKRSFGTGSSRPVIRGFDGDRVLVLSDGIRSGNLGSQSGDHGETADPLAAERIEVVKGPATLLYGSNAIGGVVNVITNDSNESHEGFRGFFSTLGGTANRERSVSGGGEYGFEKWVFRGNMSAQYAGDYNTPLGRIPNSATRATTGSFGAGYYGDKAWLSGSFTSSIRRYGIPFGALFEGHGHDDDDLASPSGTIGGGLPEVDEDIDLRLRSYNYRLSGGFKNLESPFISGIQYNVDFTNYRHKEIEIEDGEEEVGSVFDNKTFSYRTVFEQTKNGRLTGRFGFEGLSRNYKVEGAEQLIEGKIKQNSFSAFALEELNFDRIKFQFGGRLESNRYNAANPAYRDRSFTGLSGAAGVNIGLWKGGAFVTNFSTSFRAPALEELYNNGPHIGTVTYEIGNEDLKAERANGVDFSLRHISDRFRFTGDFFVYGIKNFVYFEYQDEDLDGEVDIDDGLPVAEFEQDNARYYGAEFLAEANITNNISGFVGMDMVRAKLTDKNEFLPRIPPMRFRVGADFRYEGLSVRPELVFASKQDRLAPLETPTDGYGLVNITGSYTIARQHFAHVFSVSSYNLTDKLYRNHLSYIKNFAPEMGRGVRFGYTVRFF